MQHISCGQSHDVTLQWLTPSSLGQLSLCAVKLLSLQNWLLKVVMETRKGAQTSWVCPGGQKTKFFL